VAVVGSRLRDVLMCLHSKVLFLRSGYRSARTGGGSATDVAGLSFGRQWRHATSCGARRGTPQSAVR
jgi:hypothetical protein